METTISIEFTSDTREHLKSLEQQLKHIHDVHVDMVEPRVDTAPALVGIGIGKGGERGHQAAQSVAQVLHDFLHTDANSTSQKKIYLVTIEGDRRDIESLSTQSWADYHHCPGWRITIAPGSYVTLTLVRFA